LIPSHLHVPTATSDETRALGTRLAASLPPLHETFVVVYLRGDLGAGKTTLVGGFVHALGVTGPVRSPTYTLVEIYEAQPGTDNATQTLTPALTAVHLDLYRLADPSELEPLGLSEYAAPRHVWLIEWPERGGDHLPPPDLTISLAAGADVHKIEISAATPLGETWLNRLIGLS
jgi:tRNA threonylcarbamoyladenosine biosynthesis protein TsaE